MLRRILDSLVRRVALKMRTEESLATVSRGEQLILAEMWRARAKLGHPPYRLADVEFRAFSQTGEDGLLLYVFALIGFSNRVVVELGCGDGHECNSANLIINHGFTGVLYDGDSRLVARARQFFARSRDSKVWPPEVVQAFITKENINDLLMRQGCTGEIDLLSIDIDGMDFWIWDSLNAVQPRVVIVEANNVWGATKALTVPYAPQFAATYLDGAPDYAGASLLAFTRLATKRGYRLVGSNRYGFNAVFVREGVGEEILPEVSVESCLSHPQALHAVRVRAPRVSALPTVRIAEDGSPEGGA